MDKTQLSDGHLTLSGTTAENQVYELTADVESVEIVVDSDVDRYDFWNEYHSLPLSNETYWIKLRKKDNGEVYRVELETVEIERTARILADDRTAAALEAARVRVGAPEYAKFDFGYMTHTTTSLESTILEPTTPTPVMVHFYWTERKVK